MARRAINFAPWEFFTVVFFENLLYLISDIKAASRNNSNAPSAYRARYVFWV